MSGKRKKLTAPVSAGGEGDVISGAGKGKQPMAMGEKPKEKKMSTKKKKKRPAADDNGAAASTDASGGVSPPKKSKKQAGAATASAEKPKKKKKKTAPPVEEVAAQAPADDDDGNDDVESEPFTVEKGTLPMPSSSSLVYPPHPVCPSLLMPLSTVRLPPSSWATLGCTPQLTRHDRCVPACSPAAVEKSFVKGSPETAFSTLKGKISDQSLKAIEVCRVCAIPCARLCAMLYYHPRHHSWHPVRWNGVHGEAQLYSRARSPAVMVHS